MTLEEQLYEFWHKTYVYYKFKSKARAIVNWDEIKQKPEWIYFVKTAELFKRLNGQLSIEIYITSLFEHFNGPFKLEILGTQKSLGIYNDYLKLRNLILKPEEVYKLVIKSISFIVKFCRENKLSSFYDYFYDKSLYPRFIAHYISGEVCKQFVALIPNIKKKLENFPQDIVADAFSRTDLQELIFIRDKILGSNQKLDYLAMNLERIINETIKK